MIDVDANWRRVSERVAAAAAAAGREARDVRIIAVAKTKPVEMISAAVAAGVTDVGENYVQEAVEKVRCIGAAVRWHMIGRLQRNKATKAVELFDVIHSLDSFPLGMALARHGERRGRPVRVLVEVNVAGEATKAGIAPAQVSELLAGLATQPGVEIDGLMTVAPAAPTPEAVRPYFRALRELRDRLRADAAANAPLRELSMGMTDDFEVAIEEGATMVRIGRAIFGERT